MARVKWETMTDESQAMVKKVGLINIGGVILLAFSKMSLPVGLAGWRPRRLAALFKK